MAQFKNNMERIQTIEIRLYMDTNKRGDSLSIHFQEGIYRDESIEAFLFRARREIAEVLDQLDQFDTTRTVYRYKDRDYEVIFDSAEDKTKKSKKEFVVYRPLTETNIYVRERGEFYAKFEKL